MELFRKKALTKDEFFEKADQISPQLAQDFQRFLNLDLNEENINSLYDFMTTSCITKEKTMETYKKDPEHFSIITQPLFSKKDTRAFDAIKVVSPDFHRSIGFLFSQSYPVHSKDKSVPFYALAAKYYGTEKMIPWTKDTEILARLAYMSRVDQLILSGFYIKNPNNPNSEIPAIQFNTNTKYYQSPVFSKETISWMKAHGVAIPSYATRDDR